MGWFTRKSNKEPVAREEIWTRCPACNAHVYKEEWEKALKVCPKCNYHDRLTCDERIAVMMDKGSFKELYRDIMPSDPLKFVDATGSYADKLEESRKKTGMNEAVKTGRGKIGGMKVIAAVMDFRFVGGSLSSGTGEKIALAAGLALRKKLPYIIVSASGGARMQEGIISLMQMAKTCAAVQKLHKAGIPYISVITNPTFGGVSASYAMVGDINVAEPGALVGFAGRRVIEQTIKQKLPPDFQTAEYLIQHGFLDAIISRGEMREQLGHILEYWNAR